jgi:hypothetical protein
MKKFKIGQLVNYKNGSISIYTGKIVKVKDTTLIIIDSEAGMQLWDAGHAVGSEISINQIIK